MAPTEDIIKNLEQWIEKERTELDQKLSMLQAAEKSRDILKNSLNRWNSVTVRSNRFKGMRLGAAIREYLYRKGASATIQELIEVLAAGGCSEGKYPKRSVKLAIVNNPSLFEISNDLVYLKLAPQQELPKPTLEDRNEQTTETETGLS